METTRQDLERALVMGDVRLRQWAIAELAKKGYRPAPYDSNGEGAGEPVTCPHCGKGDARDAKYCDQCGFKLEGASGVIVKARKKAFDAAHARLESAATGNVNHDAALRHGHALVENVARGKKTPDEAKLAARQALDHASHAALSSGMARDYGSAHSQYAAGMHQVHDALSDLADALDGNDDDGEAVLVIGSDDGVFTPDVTGGDNGSAE